MQARIGALPPVGRVRLAIRVGFHFGPALEVEGDVLRRLRQCRRHGMAALAKGEQVILSAQTAAALAPVLRARVREIDSLTVKGKQTDIGIFELIWQASDNDLTALAHAAGDAARAHPSAPRRAGDRPRARQTPSCGSDAIRRPMS